MDPMTRMTNVAIMTMITMTGTGCGGSLPKFDATKPVYRDRSAFGVQYQQNGQRIDSEDMSLKLLAEPKSAPHVEESRVLAAFNVLFAGVGSGLTAVPVGQWAADSRDSNWMLALYGISATLLSIPFAVASNRSMDNAVMAHNEMLLREKAKAPGKSTSAATWKPGQMAGVPSAFGYVLGSSKMESRGACEKAGHQWTEADGLFRCSGVPSKAISGGWSQLEFKNDKLSAVEILMMPPNNPRGWMEALKNTGSAVTDAYGQPVQRRFDVPDDCKAEEVFLGCLAEGKIKGSALWYPNADHAAVLDIVSAPLPATSILRLKIARRPPAP